MQNKITRLGLYNCHDIQLSTLQTSFVPPGPAAMSATGLPHTTTMVTPADCILVYYTCS